MAIKKCPHCGGVTFLAKTIRASRVESVEGTFNILQETKKYDLEILKCNDCKENVTLEDLIETVACKQCGTLTVPNNLDENGICDVCRAIKVRPDLAAASKEDLIRMLLKLEHTPKSIQKTEEKANVQIESKPEKLEEELEELTEIAPVSNEKDSNVSESVKDRMAIAKAAIKAVSEESSIKEESTENKAEEKPTKDKTATEIPKTTTRKKRAVRKSKTSKESPVEEKEKDEKVNEDIDTPVFENTNISDASVEEQAPFPKQEQVLQDMFNQQPSQEEAPALPSGGFPLFNNDDEQSF